MVDHYLREFHAGRCEDAFHSLIEAGPAHIPELINAFYEGGNDIETKVFVIEVISEFRLDSSLGFLRHILRRDEERIWKAALNGMAQAESLESVDAMDHVLSSVRDPDKIDWIKEAIADTGAAIAGRLEKGGGHWQPGRYAGRRSPGAETAREKAGWR